MDSASVVVVVVLSSVGVMRFDVNGFVFAFMCFLTFLLKNIACLSRATYLRAFVHVLFFCVHVHGVRMSLLALLRVFAAVYRLFWSVLHCGLFANVCLDIYCAVVIVWACVLMPQLCALLPS